MKNDDKTKRQLIDELTQLRSEASGLEKTRKELESIKKSEDAAREFSESIINTVREPLLVTVSRSFYEFFKITLDNYGVEHEIPIVKRGIER